MMEHANGIAQTSYTFDRRPVSLVHLESFREVLDAIAREKQIKQWSRRKKEALMQQDEKRLKHYSRRSHLSQ